MGLEQTEADLQVQRSIEGRYLPSARAERRTAQADAREALKPAPSHVGWDTRPTKADLARERAADRARADRARHSADADKKLRSDRAKQLRKADRALHVDLRERDQRWDHKRHGTPATFEHAAQHRTGALARLCVAGAITADQLAASEDIDQVHEQIARDVTPRTASFETRIDGGQRGDGKFYEALGRVQRERAYRDWSSAVGASIAVVLEMIVDRPPGYSVVAKRRGMSPTRAKRLLIDALDLWWSMLALARREISQSDLDDAHAMLER